MVFPFSGSVTLLPEPADRVTLLHAGNVPLVGGKVVINDVLVQQYCIGDEVGGLPATGHQPLQLVASCQLLSSCSVLLALWCWRIEFVALHMVFPFSGSVTLLPEPADRVTLLHAGNVPLVGGRVVINDVLVQQYCIGDQVGGLPATGHQPLQPLLSSCSVLVALWCYGGLQNL